MIQWRKDNPSKAKHSALWDTYKITIDQYNQMIIYQDRKCALCSNTMKHIHVDHCHKSNKIRGLLCSKCNTGLGQFNDNIELLQLAIDYLKSRQ